MTDLIDVLLPVDQAEGTRSQVLRWLKSVGQPVARHEPLVEIETDKVTVEVSAPADGILGEIVAAEGVDVAPGALLGRLAPAAARAGASLAP
ncbi:MAG: biotin/lipoyl-containing protein, partial [Steroidobacteraceae bacterium]